MALANKAAPYDVDLMRDMKIAQTRHGASFMKQVSDFLALRSAGTGMSFEEYLFFGLYNRPHTDYSAFMGDHRARAAFYVANDLRGWDAADDKISFAEAAAKANLPAPALRAVVHKMQTIEGAQQLASQEEIHAFLKTCPLPVFGKPNRASHGDGAVTILQREEGMLVAGDSQISIKDLVSEVAAYLDAGGYVFQEMLKPHDVISKITKGRVASLRVLTLLGENGAVVKSIVARFPAGDNQVDNFRRCGNLVAPVDVETGVLGAAQRGVGVTSESVLIHPDTNAQIEGVHMPDIEQAKKLACEAAVLYPNLHLQSWDIALTPDGPKLLEVNPGGNFNIIQLANGRGVFDPEFRSFLEWCLNVNTSSKSNAKALKEAKKLLNLK
ncbi:sugar-transfer associated ATP-grasp domain-containing protein [Hyphococcus flavus]|uniref:Sugar-transfer associated ATP-grasp domain-containing protein n=1 Tax=Hyphococcus flavus TaxID=1866326 RepID=A0AAF0CCB6_9PROT|nr:sugar-transfer associated ATP-grasp domain-containing protein [Hyphococcus flavus]WDI33085.1 sugar-transfer associated ATP-grasp domain-containing protein [Hyphococcus flavus]